MKSPFPGMDPYLEQFWRDVHQRLIVYSCDALQSSLPDQLRARVEERVFVESDEVQYRSFYPDVHVVEHSPLRQPVSAPQPPASATEGDVAVEDPLLVHIRDEPITQSYIEIVEAGSGNRVITVIEFLSPSNKAPGEGQDLYLQKQREVQGAGASLVEIDLTRSGRRRMLVPLERTPRSHRTTYQVCVLRGWVTGQVEMYRAPLERRLPVIRVPLRQTDEDASLDLQALIDQCYANGRYDDLDYQADPLPPLNPHDAAWADELLRSRESR